jgi:hypothetical protein
MRKGVILVFLLICVVGGGIILYQYNETQKRRARLGIQKYALGESVEEVTQRKAFVEGQTAVQVADWSGKKPADLSRAFPGAPALAGGGMGLDIGEVAIPNWRGWERLTLSFTESRLTGAAFTSRFSLSEEEVCRLLTQKFGLSLPPSNYFKEGNDRGYENLSGKVVSVVFVNERRSGTSGMPTLWAAAAGKAAEERFRTKEIVLKFSGK